MVHLGLDLPLRRVLSALLLLASAAGAAPAPLSARGSSTAPKVILDNDWGTAGFLPFLMSLTAGWDVLGLTSSTSNSWALQCGLHALATLEVGGLEGCVPVHRGADYPLLNKPGLFQAWEAVHGKLAWEGAFALENRTYEAEGYDPTSGSPERVVREAFYEGFPNASFASRDAAWFMVEQVRKFPGQVSIYAAGALTNVALAVRMDPDFARNARELVVMGGYIDVNLLQVTGSTMQADWNSDINLMIDPEGSKIALTARFPNITLVGNGANQIPADAAMLEDLYSVKNAYTELYYKYAGTLFPFWDETAAAAMLDPGLVTNSTSFFLDVDTNYGSPTYGNIHAYQEALAPTAQNLRKVNYVVSVEREKTVDLIRRSIQQPKTCADVEAARR